MKTNFLIEGCGNTNSFEKSDARLINFTAVVTEIRIFDILDHINCYSDICLFQYLNLHNAEKGSPINNLIAFFWIVSIL